MTFTLSPELIIALVLNLLTAGALWGNFSTRLSAVEREQNKHSSWRDTVTELTTKVERMVKDIEELGTAVKDIAKNMGGHSGMDGDTAKLLAHLVKMAKA